MLSLLLVHIIITVSCLLSGALFYSFLTKNNGSRSVIFYLVSGLILLTAVTQLLVLFVPINIYIRLFVFVLLVIGVLSKWKKHKVVFSKLREELSIWPRLSIALFLLSWIIILLINAGRLVMDDTESYHIQSIKWIQEYGSVPGLVNLHERFGFNSSWFSSVALFSFFPGSTGGSTALNSVLSMWLCFWFINVFNAQRKENNIPAAFSILSLFICCLIIWPLLRGNAASTNYDFVTTTIILILFFEIFLSKDFSPTIEWLVWPAYLFTIRIINFPLLLLGLIALIHFIRQKNFKELLLPLAYCLLLIIPFVVRNTIIAGYPFYPATSFDLVDIDWKPDPQMTEKLLEYIKYYNRVSTTYMEIEQTKALGADWIPSWFAHLFLFDKALVIAGVTGIFLTIVKLFNQRNKNTFILTGISAAWLICWFIISPDPRFIYGILLFGIVMLAYQFASIIKNGQLIKVSMDIIIIAMIAGSSFYFISKLLKQEAYRNFLFPAKLPQPPVKEFVVNGIPFHIPEPINNNWNARCYGTSLPCLYKIDPRLKARGKDIQNGFRLEK